MYELRAATKLASQLPCNLHGRADKGIRAHPSAQETEGFGWGASKNSGQRLAKAVSLLGHTTHWHSKT